MHLGEQLEISGGDAVRGEDRVSSRHGDPLTVRLDRGDPEVGIRLDEGVALDRRGGVGARASRDEGECGKGRGAESVAEERPSSTRRHGLALRAGRNGAENTKRGTSHVSQIEGDAHGNPDAPARSSYQT